MFPFGCIKNYIIIIGQARRAGASPLISRATGVLNIIIIYTHTVEPLNAIDTSGIMLKCPDYQGVHISLIFIEQFNINTPLPLHKLLVYIAYIIAPGLILYIDISGTQKCKVKARASPIASLLDNEAEFV